MQEQPLLLESNQNHATVQTEGICTTLPASMGEGGGYVPMVCMDAYQHHGYRESESCNTLTADQNTGVRGDTPLAVTVSQDAYDKYTENSVSATIKQSGGAYGGAAKPL